MTDVGSTDDLDEIVGRLERDPLRNIVLLKQIAALRDNVSAVQLFTERSVATMVLLDTKASAYDREAYPEAAFAALISSDDPTLTRRLLASVPRRGDVVFKLAGDTDRDVVAEHFAITRATSYLSFTADGPAA